MFLALHPMESIYLNSFVLLEHQAMLLPSTLNIGIINFAKHFLNLIGATMISYLNSKLDLNLSYAKDFRNLNYMVTWRIN